MLGGWAFYKVSAYAFLGLVVLFFRIVDNDLSVSEIDEISFKIFIGRDS
jgi:hypothetical protein